VIPSRWLIHAAVWPRTLTTARHPGPSEPRLRTTGYEGYRGFGLTGTAGEVVVATAGEVAVGTAGEVAALLLA
jgi:hypothetical protein